jgi:uncharacterized protein (DUF2235 family)
MSRNIVICSDGTGNSFTRRPSNVARLVELLSLEDSRRQVIVYGQGIGTDSRRAREIEHVQAKLRDRDALVVLRGPYEAAPPPTEWLALLAGLAFGFGLRENVRQMYQQLARLYENGDRVFLFGFSRGAFAVRALAGLLYRCGLPRLGRHADRRLFKRAWTLYQPMRWSASCVSAFLSEEQQRACPIHFLGIWDTVKSYGGLRPVILAHLRHNPTVANVRHALALDEERGWFDATTWGRLDLDKHPDRAWSRLADTERDAIVRQDVEEVWFRGCHSDVGGGGGEATSARIALRWVLAEAVEKGIEINEGGWSLVETPEPERALVNQSHTLVWRLIEVIPRRTIDNFGRWPKRAWAWGDARRHPSKLVRDGQISLHESVHDYVSRGRLVRTRSPQRTR